ncbi:MAG: hypothetical protein LBJ65_19810 [Burkholderia sp.]|uniref:M35 family metallo-endopeptidase n=1 Tax=Burkholderia sp. TaxID=36773 RepID=UPI002820819C|nr:M35 family metallo-endopeptidase [Burkholderia sp.]MDR0243846.1 hypothetical protein [Burkholderia sp.]
MTNTTQGSTVKVFLTLDGPRICPAMTDAEFRKLMMELRDEGADLMEERLKRLAEWAPEERRRVWTWFGANDDGIRLGLVSGLTATLAVMRALGPGSFLRAHPDLDRSLGCLPTNKNVGTVAHVCGPDTATRTISIHEEFCSIRDRSRAATSKLSTIIHECTHFKDTFGASDPKYGITRFLPEWGQANPEKAIKNADSISAYVIWLD